jgi:hypothetical protein
MGMWHWEGAMFLTGQPGKALQGRGHLRKVLEAPGVRYAHLRKGSRTHLRQEQAQEGRGSEASGWLQHGTKGG